MGDHSKDTSDSLPPPIRVDDGDFTPTYDPSPDLTELGPMIYEIGASFDRLFILGLTPHYSITGMECRKMPRLTLSLPALVTVDLLLRRELPMAWGTTTDS